MTDTPKPPRGRPPTDTDRRQIRLPRDLLDAWDAATTDERRDALRRGLLADTVAR